MKSAEKIVFPSLIVALFGLLLPVAAAPLHLAEWDDLDALIEAEYESLAIVARIFPPAEFRFGVSHPPVTFNSTAFAHLTNAVPPQTNAGVPTWPLYVLETQAVSRAWIIYSGNIPLHTNAVPYYDTAAWSRQAYGDPPHWLQSAELERWYRARARDRIALGLTLIPAERYDEYRANLRAAATNVPYAPTVPVYPADTNRVAFARLKPVLTGTLGFDLYSPASLPVDIFTKTNLVGNQRWSYAGTVQTTEPFTPAAVATAGSRLFLHAARGDIDSDGDGIPDGMELLHFGTDPHLWDSSGDGLSDWIKIYRYGLDPLLRDSDGDGYGDDEEVLAGTDPTQPTPGASPGAVRYYRDADDRVIGVYSGDEGRAATATITPVGNPSMLQERGER